MATQIGVVKVISGNVTATAADGSIRTLQVGDAVYANELISTSQAGAVELEFADGSVMDLGRSSQSLLDSNVFNPDTTSIAELPSEDVPDDVAAIQQALLEGEDPTEVGEATAAGAGVAGSGNEGHEAVFVNYLNPEVTPEAGFDTIGVNSEIEDYEDEQLVDGTPTAGLVTVLLDEDDLNFFESNSFVQNLLSQIQSEFQSDTNLVLQDQPQFGVRDTTSPGDDFPSPSSTFFSGTLNANYGSDGPGTISFNPAGTQPSGLTSGGQPVQIWVSADGLTLIGYIASDNDDYGFSTLRQLQEGPQLDGAEIIFSAQITNLETYAFQAGLFGPIDHPDTAEEGSFEENLLLNIAFTITDSDGDAAQGIVQLNVDDDSPVIGSDEQSPQFEPRTLSTSVEEAYQSSANADEDDIYPEGVGNTDSDGDDAVTTINLPINYGADGPAAENPVEFSAEGILDQNGNPLTSNGVEVQFSWNAATNTLEGTADGQPVVNVHVDVFDYGFGSDTVVSVQLFDNLDHPIGADGEFLGTEDNLNITLNYTATDGDGDQAYGSVSVSVDDDMPVIGTPEAVSVDEEGINGNAGDSYEVVNGVLLIPELENGDLNAALDSDAKQAIKSFVEAGGQLVVNGSYFSEDESLINDIFGFAITQGSIDYSNVPTYSQTANVAGTDYASGPAQLNDADGTYTWDISSLPAGATVMYSDGDDAAVVTIPVGDGQITFLAYDWYDAAPTGSQDSGWTDILNIAVSANGSPADVSVFDNGSYVDSSGGTSAESDNIQATLQSQGHNVSTFTGITLADILAALPELTTGDLAGEDTVATGSLAINWGADDNNDAESDFDRSVAFTNQIAPEGLTAGDQPVSYMISEDGIVLTAYTGELETDSYSEVFTVTLSDEGNGSYEFNLLGNLDHPEANTEDDIDLNFEFIATDSDGDSAVGNFNVTVDDDAPIASGETVEFTIDEDDIRTELSEGNEPNDGDDTDGSFTGSPLSPFDNGPANVSGSVASLVSFGADGAGTITLGENFDALLAQNLTSQGEALSYSVDGNVLSAEADGRDVFTLTLEANGEFTFALSEQLDHADANGENNLPIDLSSVIVATDADGDAITLESGFVINVTDDVPEQAGLLPEIGIVEDEALPNGNQELNDFITTIDLGFLGTITIALDGWPDTAIATGSLTEQVSIGADDPATFSLSGDYTQLIAQNLTSDDEPLSYAVQGNTLYAVANQTPIFTLTLDANGDYTFTLMGPLDHADGILEENLLAIDFSSLVVVTDADGDQITLDEDFFIKVVDDSPEVGDNARVRLDDDALEGGNPGGPGDNTDSANVTGTLSHSFGADGGSISWQTTGAPNGFSYEADGNDLLVKQDGETVLTLTLDPQTGEYSVTQNAPIDHRDNGNNNENNQNFNIAYLVTDGDGDTATGSLRVNVDDDTPTVAEYEVNTMRIISDDDTVAGLNGNPGGVGDSNEYNQVKTLQFSVGADGGTVAWNTDTSSVEDATAGITFAVDGDGSLLIMQDQGGAEPVQVAIVTLDENTGDYVYTQTANVLHTPGNDENEASFKLGFTVTDGDGDSADGYVTLLIDDDTPTVADYEVNTMRIISDDDTVAGLNGNPGEGANTNDGAGTDSKEYNQTKTLQFSAGADGGTVAWNADNSSVDDGTAGISFSVNGDGSLVLTQEQDGVPVEIAVITLDENTGDYTYTQTGNVLHTAGDAENEAAFTLGFTVTDGDGDTADGHLTLLIDDDTPVITSQQINLLSESFENFAPGLSGNNWTVVGEGGGTIIGNNGIEWTVNGAGIEIQTGNVGGSAASDGNAHAELDSHDSNGDGGTTLTVLSTQVELPTPDAILSFDFKPRPGSVADSDISVSLGGNTVTLDTDAAGNIDFGTLPAGVTATQSTSANGWTTVTLSFTGLDTDSAQTLAFEGLGNANSLGGYLDNINLNAGVNLTVDESALADGNSEAGASTVASFDFSGFFTGEFGADGAGSESYSLNLNGSDVASGLFAVDNTDTETTDGDGFGQGSEIVLNEVNGEIVGSVGGVEYFTISVNAETGEVTLTQLDNIWQPDAQNPDDSQSLVLDAETLSLIKEITDADADSVSATLDLSGGLFNFEDDAPTISSEQPAVSLEMTVTNHNEVSSAGYNSSYGYYIKGESGEPTDGVIIWNNVQDPANESATVTLEGVSAEQVGFFIIPNGFNNNSGLENDTEVTFVEDGSGHWQALVDGQPLAGSGSNVLFDVAALNNDGQDHVQDNELTGNQNWEDLQIPTGDGDYNDVNVNVELTRVGGITVDETDLDSSASDSMNLAGSFDISFGADGEGNVAYALSVDSEVETGLVDTLSDKPVQLRINGAGEVEGYITTDDDFDLVVFTASVDAAGEVTLTQLRAVEHDDVDDHDEALSPATINAGAIALAATVTDADGDSASDSIDVGVLFAFEDDGPSVGEQTAAEVDEGETVEGQLVFDAGEDGGEVTAVNGTTLTFGQDGFSQEIELEHGTLQVKANGEYSYSVDSGSVEQDEVENFNFTVTDGDGDTAQGAVAVTIVNAQVSDVITLNDVNVNEGAGTATITGSVENPVTGTPLVITLDNGATITIPVGSSSAASTPFLVQGDDVYVDGDSYTVAVTGTTGGNYSSLDTSDDATVTISDTKDTVTATLSTATTEVSEEGGDIIYTVTLTGGPGAIDPDANLVINLANGEQVTILAGQTSGSVTATYTDADITNQTAITNSISGVASGGTEYEDLQTAGTTSVDVNYNPVIEDLTPQAQGGDVSVDEDDLTDGSDASKESTTQEGTFTISAADGIDDLTIGGEAVITDGVFSATSFTTALGNTLSVTGFDAGTGEVTYTYELTDNTLTHGPANNGENNIFENFDVVLSDVDGDLANDVLSVQIVDDVPTATADSVESNEGSSATLGADLVLMIDRSGSVSNSDLNSLKSSLQTLFNNGSVHSVFITSFSSGGQFHDSGVDGGWFTNLDAAMAVINGLSSGGTTDYDAALEAVTDNFTAPPAGGGQLVSMFISDGEPNETNGTGTYGIIGSEETNWINFLDSNGFDDSFAVGYNGLDSGDIGYLEPIAWTEGETSSTYTGSDDDNVIILDNVDDLAVTFGSTVTTTPNPVTGNVLDNDEAGADGFGAPALVDVTYDGNTVTFSGSTTSATFNTDAGTVVINSDGSYEFIGLADAADDISAVIGYTIVDADGDTSTSSLTVSTLDSEPTAFDNVNNAVLTEEVVPSSTSTQDLADLHAQVNDNGPGGQAINVREFTIYGSQTGEIEFDIDVDGSEFRSGDSFNISLYELNSPGTPVAGQTFYNDSDYNNISVGGLAAGSYRLVLTLNDSGNGPSSKDLHVDLEDITVKRTSAPTTQAVVFAALGNVMTDANALVNSTDPWGATDDQGADGASVSAINGANLATLSDSTNSTYAAAEGYKEYDAAYGTFYINADGDYAYVPDADMGNLGQQETFSYTLTQPDGDSDTANLVINLADSEFVAQTPTSTGTSGDDLMLGTAGEDVLDGAAGDDHIEGGEGADTLIGGEGNDILIGGDGADIFQWNDGDEGTAGSPAVDFITDFSAAEGDSLDLADLLQGEESGDITDYISVAQNGSDVVIEVTPDGNGGDMNQIITLQNTTVDQLAGGDTSGMSQADIINTLITNGQLNVDQS